MQVFTRSVNYCKWSQCCERLLGSLCMYRWHHSMTGNRKLRGPYCQLGVGLCDVDVFLHWNSAVEEGAGVGLKLDLKKAPDSTC